MQTSADVVIIGAGVIGCSTAYHLARLGITDVVVVEMDSVGAGTSSKSASMLSLQFNDDELLIRMAKYSYSRYMAFEDELGVPIDFRRTGWLSLATEETAADLRGGAELLESLGVKTDILEPGEVKRLYPEINVEDICLATWGPDDGPFDPHMIVWGYVKRAREMGVRLHERVRATGISVSGGRVVGVETEAGFIAAPTIVNAAGPWAIEVGGLVGIQIPIINLARSVLVTGPLPAIPQDRPLVHDVTDSWYYRPEGAGVLIGMGKEPVESLEVHVSEAMKTRMIELAVHRVPALEQASLLTSWAGVRPMTADDRPILGPVLGIDGFVVNCGWGGMGIIQSPLAGQLAAEFIANGSAETFDIAPLTLDRFL